MAQKVYSGDLTRYEARILEGTKSEMLQQLIDNHRDGYYQVVKLTDGSQNWWALVHSVTDDEVYIMDSSAKGYTKLSECELAGPVQMYTKNRYPVTWRDEDVAEYVTLPDNMYYIRNELTGTYMHVKYVTAEGVNVGVAENEWTKEFRFYLEKGLDEGTHDIKPELFEPADESVLPPPGLCAAGCEHCAARES